MATELTFHGKHTMSKRPQRKARRKARRAKVKTEIERWRESIYAQMLDLDKRVRSLEETVDTALETKSDR